MKNSFIYEFDAIFQQQQQASGGNGSRRTSRGPSQGPPHSSHSLDESVRRMSVQDQHQQQVLYNSVILFRRRVEYLL